MVPLFKAAVPKSKRLMLRCDLLPGQFLDGFFRPIASRLACCRVRENVVGEEEGENVKLTYHPEQPCKSSAKRRAQYEEPHLGTNP